MQPANYIAGFPTHPCFSDSGSGQEEQPALLCALSGPGYSAHTRPASPSLLSLLTRACITSRFPFLRNFFFNGSFFMSRSILLANE